MSTDSQEIRVNVECDDGTPTGERANAVTAAAAQFLGAWIAEDAAGCIAAGRPVAAKLYRETLLRAANTIAAGAMAQAMKSGGAVADALRTAHAERPILGERS